jgi:hypothetical protein
MPSGLQVNLEIAPSGVSAKVKPLDRVLTPAESALRRRIRNQFLVRDSRIVSSAFRSLSGLSTARILHNAESQKCYRFLAEKRQRETCRTLVSHIESGPAIFVRDHADSSAPCSCIFDDHIRGLRRFMGRRFALCVVRAAQRLLHCATRFALDAPTRSL